MLAHVCENFASASIFPKMGYFSELQLLDIIPMAPSIHHLRDTALNYRFVSSSDVLAAASNTGCKYLLKFLQQWYFRTFSSLLQSGLPTKSGNLLEKLPFEIGAVELKCSRSHLGVVKAPEDLQNTHRCPCNHHLVVHLLPQGTHLLGQGQAEQGCAIIRGALAAILQAQQFSLTKGLGPAPCRNTPGSAVLPKSSRGIQGLWARRVLELNMFIPLRVFPGPLRCSLAPG